jgi:hypothetical protein
MKYIVKRTQLYMEEDVWKTLEMTAREQRCSISGLVRRAGREKYVSSPSRKSELLKAIVGIWRDRNDLGRGDAFVRKLRKGERLRRIHG